MLKPRALRWKKPVSDVNPQLKFLYKFSNDTSLFHARRLDSFARTVLLPVQLSVPHEIYIWSQLQYFVLRNDPNEICCWFINFKQDNFWISSEASVVFCAQKVDSTTFGLSCEIPREEKMSSTISRWQSGIYSSQLTIRNSPSCWPPGLHRKGVWLTKSRSIGLVWVLFFSQEKKTEKDCSRL